MSATTSRLVAALAALVLSACARAPTQEMSDARQALGAAREAGAERTAPAAYQRALVHLDAATISLQNGAYKSAREEAVAAHGAALDARRVAEAIAHAESAVSEAVASAARDDADRLLASALAAAARGESDRAIDLAERAVRRASVAN